MGLCTLELRKTHKYVGTCRHLDEWESIGSYTPVQVHVTEVDGGGGEPDPCDPLLHKHEVAVESDAPEEQIRQALKDSFTMSGCAHEYDCCGCRSFHATSAEPIDGSRGRWRVVVSSSRNY